MSMYLDPTGQSTYGLGICGRCSKKMFLADLHEDPNVPGLRVCKDDLDNFDPYRLAPRENEKITLPFNRPDTDISLRPAGLIQENGDQFLITEDGESYLEL